VSYFAFANPDSTLRISTFLTSSPDQNKSQRISDYRHFFLDVLPVPPPRFRPASKLGDQTFENTQNVHLTAILTVNTRLLELQMEKKKIEMEAKVLLFT